MTRVLIVSEDVVGTSMAGPAIRCTEFARALAAHHPVTLAVPVPAALPAEPFTLAVYDGSSLPELVRGHDVLVLSGFLLYKYPFLKQTGKPLVVDIYDPFVLENLEIHRGKSLPERAGIHAVDLGVQLDLLRCGDFFICASERQRDFWLGMLLALNRVNPMSYEADREVRRLIDVVPFGIPAAPPRHTRQVLKGVVPGIGPADTVLLWGGGIWNWFDPLTLINALAAVGRQRDDVKLFFLGTKHPNPDIPEMEMCRKARDLSDTLGLTGKLVFFNDWVPYADRQNYLLEADAGVSLHFEHLETKFSFRTRILDCIWAALPVITTGGDALSDLIEREGLGQTVAAGDQDAVAQAIRRVAADAPFTRACRDGLRRVAPAFHWERVTAPLLRFCDSPYRTRDAGGLSVEASTLLRPFAARLLDRLRRR
jgi:glycosyltransferase involved in cell wall biosynthesis